MENVLEADYGLGPLRDVEESINAGIAKLFERNKREPWFDGLWMNEYGEVLYGALLVAGQAYCVASVIDINEIRKSKNLKPLGKIEAYRHCQILRNGHSAIELINAAANCFKHRDEWGATWPKNLTTKVLSAFEITSATEFPLNEAQRVVHVELRYPTLSGLVSEWRKGLLSKIKQEC